MPLFLTAWSASVFHDFIQFLAHLRQKLIGLARAVAGVGQRQQRQRMHFHDLAQLGQLVHGRAFLVALQRTQIGTAGHVGERFLAQAARFPDCPYRRRQ